ncbi:hypothetical protein TorRG33x02_291320 [Trema orientale]|uniref:Uncharacterized protein n=1 Tax=Trema orientale TaxID=63057 RepID=A0A2P5CBG9_TREOI|nr:hypothetical protein TorRG33x02_291320 [Trema orientale]
MNADPEDCYRVDVYESLVMKTFEISHIKDPLEDTILNRSNVVSKGARECLHAINISPCFDRMHF